MYKVSKSVDIQERYCVYVVTYSGDKMPPFYIGYCKTKNITEGNYYGSVTSVKYSSIFFEELKENPHLFRRKIIKTFTNSPDAKNLEKEILMHFNAKHSNLFINRNNGGGSKDFAGRPKGSKNKRFLVDTSKYASSKRGKLNPMYGKPSPRKGSKHSEKTSISFKRRQEEKRMMWVFLKENHPLSLKGIQVKMSKLPPENLYHLISSPIPQM